MKRLEEGMAVVTGGSSGVGLATAKRFQQEGTKVAILGRNEKTLDEAAKLLGNGALTIRANGAEFVDLDSFYTEVRRNWAELMWCS